ncbi:hypothetical protein B0H14DRAFT_2775912 [Mycena olivaceomarginata]|nr:hypothetical protein B0H14DRAFT_2775912 [Mycena olivaceomarginata]
MTDPLLATAPSQSIRKNSGFLKFWKKSRASIPDFHAGTSQSAELVLPTEIWLEILAYIHQDNLEPLSRISWRLRSIVLPLYFRSQQIFPFRETRKLAGYQERSLRRLHFLMSDSISPAIRDLFVSPYPPVHTPVEDVMELLVVALPRFHNLVKLTLQFPPCNDTLFSSLGSLRLDYFELEVSPTALGEIPIPAHGDPNQLFTSDGLSLLAGPTGTNTLTRALLCHPSGLVSLETLDLSLRFVASAHFSEALEACPNLSSLRLRSSPVDSSAIPAFLPPLFPTTIPHLTNYHGPTSFAPALARGVSAVSAPWLLHPILPQLGPSVTALSLGITLVPDGLLETLCAAFPALAVLEINTHLDAFHPGTVLRRVLAPPIPPRARLTLPAAMRLQTLRLGTQLAGAPGAPDTEQLLLDSAREAVRAFPGDYDPTSWRRWVVDRPWYCVDWTRAANADETQFGAALEGTLRVEYGEHYFQGFERGERIDAQRVENAVLRML